MGPKRGPARGVAVFTSSHSRVTEVMGGYQPQFEQLQQWSRVRGVALDNSASSLGALDQRLDEWYADQTHFEQVNLPVEVGMYLGHVIVMRVEGSRWIMWPNGHPVVRLRTARELDVTAMVSSRIDHGGRSLEDILADAEHG
jgi:Family of unknown function (DUF6278)